MKNLFNNDKLNLGFDTTTFAKHIPMFEGKLGKNKPMMMKLTFKEIEMKFANNDTDISFAYLMSYKLYLEEDPKTMIFEDEIPMFTSFKVYMEDDVLYPKIIKHKLNFGHIPMKSKPTKTTFDVTKNEYNKYLTDMRMTMEELKKMFNDI